MHLAMRKELTQSSEQFYIVETVSQSRIRSGRITFPVCTASRRCMQIMQVEFTLKDTWAESFKHTKYVWQTWESWMQKQLDSAPEGLKTGFQTGNVRSRAHRYCN